MKGVLWKWTNYWNGWQPRWFILENGLLSYYKSEEEVTQGCKGSLSVAACEINVHPTDVLRLDIVIQGEQHIYVRAANIPERQQWLVALGTAKAQGSDTGLRTSTDASNSSDSLRAKKSELRLYCDLIMQQVHSIKESASTESGLDVVQLDECTKLLSATCDTFIKTLDECVKHVNATPYSTSNAQPVPVVPNINRTYVAKPKSITHSNSS